MNYNMLMITSIIICAIMSMSGGYYISLLILDKGDDLFKVVHLIGTVVLLTTFYAPIKHILIKYMNIDEFESEKKDD